MPSPTAQGACSFHIEAVDDQRESGGLGATGITRIGGEHFTRWFREGIVTTPGHGGASAPMRVRIAVTKAYFQTLYSLKAANIVVKVTATGVTGVPTQKMYRGVDSSTQWTASQAEVQSAFEGALADLQRQIAADLGAPCRS